MDSSQLNAKHAVLMETPARDPQSAATHATIEYNWWITAENTIYGVAQTAHLATIGTPILTEAGEFSEEWANLDRVVVDAAPEEVINAELDPLNRPEFRGKVGDAVRAAASGLVNIMEPTWDLGEILMKMHIKQTDPVDKGYTDMWDADFPRELRTYNEPKMDSMRKALRIRPPFISACKRLSTELMALDAPAFTPHIMRPREGKSPNAFSWGELGFGRLEHGAAQIADAYGLILLHKLQPSRMDISEVYPRICQALEVAELYSDEADAGGKTLSWSAVAEQLRREKLAAEWLMKAIPLHVILRSCERPDDSGMTADTSVGVIPARFCSWLDVLPDLPLASRSRTVRKDKKQYSLFDLLRTDKTFRLLKKKKRWSLRTLLSGEIRGPQKPDMTREITKIEENDAWLLPSEFKAALMGALGVKQMREYFKFVATRFGWDSAPVRVKPPSPYPVIQGLVAVDNGQDISVDPRLVVQGLAVGIHGGMSIFHAETTSQIKAWDADKPDNGGHKDTTTPFPLTITDPSSDLYWLFAYKPVTLYRGQKDEVIRDVDPPGKHAIEEDVALEPFTFWRKLYQERGLTRLRAERQDDVILGDEGEASAQEEFNMHCVYRGTKEEVVKAMAKSIEGVGVDVNAVPLYKTTPGYRHHVALIMRLQCRRAVLWFNGYALAYDTCRATLTISDERVRQLVLPYKCGSLLAMSASLFAAYDSRPAVSNEDAAGEA